MKIHPIKKYFLSIVIEIHPLKVAIYHGRFFKFIFLIIKTPTFKKYFLILLSKNGEPHLNEAS